MISYLAYLFTFNGLRGRQVHCCANQEALTSFKTNILTCFLYTTEGLQIALAEATWMFTLITSFSKTSI